MSMGSERYSTHVLELVRNNGVQAVEAGKGDTCFLMFDYFDVLIYKELVGETKHYLNYFSIGDIFNDDKKYKVSYKTLSIYRRQDNMQNPFTINGDAAKRIPFLGLIQISLCKENYKGALDQIGVDEFLCQCENEIMEIADKVPLVGGEGETVRLLYRSSTTGDFCLAIRTDYVENIYNIALALNDTQDKPAKSEGALSLLTYTNVGIACKSASEGGFMALDPDFVSSHCEMKFALRFSADAELMELLKQYARESGNDKHVQVVKGLFGRYDYLMHIGIGEFAEIYPVLCAKKVGPGSDKAYSPGDTHLSNILRYPHIRNINERVLVELESLQSSVKNIAGSTLQEKKTTWNDDKNDKSDYVKQVVHKNEILFKKIGELEHWGGYFSEEARAFKDLYRGMKEIYKAFSSVGAEKEAYIDWLGFYEDMCTLCDCITYSMERYLFLCDKDISGNIFSEDEKRKYKLRLLRDWRSNIQAINQYTRLVQNINYQTYQSPIYEIQTQIDTAKTMVAYREAMRSYIEPFLDANVGGIDDGAKIVPILYPDLSKDEVEVTAPFINQRQSGLDFARDIICIVPSFEYFGRLYDLLPWVIHEASHHLRIFDKLYRNNFVIRYLFSYLFEIVIEDALPKLATDKLYTAIGRAEQRLVDSLVEVAVRDMSANSEFKDFDYQRLVSEVDTYLKCLFPYQTSYEGTRHYNEGKKIRDAVFRHYLDQCRKEGILTDSNTNKLLKIKADTANEQRDELTMELLDRYRLSVFGESEPEKLNDFIQLNDIQSTRDVFEKKLSSVIKEMKDKDVCEEAIREYCYKVIAIYRGEQAYATIYRDRENPEKNIKEFLGKVYEDYQQRALSSDWIKESKFFCDPTVMHIFRHLGLLNDNQSNKEKFISAMLDIFLNVDYSRIEPDRKFRETVYRETFADLLMATSLHLTSFGYCRQVLQTISDARINQKAYQYNEVNNQRFQIVAAVLLEEEIREHPDERKREEIVDDHRYVKLDGSRIIEKGIQYCEYTLKCIGKKLLNMDDIKGNAIKEELVRQFAGTILDQLEAYLRNLKNDGSYNATLLYALLHGIETADDIIKEEWELYRNIAEMCGSMKYSFWRLEYFCRGIEDIMQGGYIRVPWDIFSHMKEIRKKIIKRDGFGSVWERDWDCLWKLKKDVGDFYNDPKLVYEKTAAQKLENTIDFIQNYYYYNRFKMMKRESRMNDGGESFAQEG